MKASFRWPAAGLFVLTLSACETPMNASHPRQVPRAESINLRPRREIRALQSLLPGLTPREVISLLGQPESISRPPEGAVWRYLDAARDGRHPIPVLIIRFSNQRVSSLGVLDGPSDPP